MGTEPGEISHILMNYSGPSFSDLPRDIMISVLLRLSIKRIFVCKIVCKTWHDLISEPDFAKLHFNQAQPYPLIQIFDYTERSRMLYLLQPKEEDFEHKLEMCDHREYKSECECRVRFGLDTKFKLPFRNPNNNRTYLRMRHHTYHVVNSCNGMLCLSDPIDNDPLAVCNPVTGEFINLPDSEGQNAGWAGIMFCGFGFSPATNQYKVIRVTLHPKICEVFDSSCIRSEVHTIGTETWKDMECSAPAVRGLCPTYLNGILYWHSNPNRASVSCLVSFDIENECFGSILAPPMKNSEQCRDMSLGVLGGELSICRYLSRVIEVWVMKDNGTKNGWSKLFSFGFKCDNIERFGVWKPIKYMNDGALLMFNSTTYSLTYIHLKKRRIRYFKLGGRNKKVLLTAHIPSFVSLKDALS